MNNSSATVDRSAARLQQRSCAYTIGRSSRAQSPSMFLGSSGQENSSSRGIATPRATSPSLGGDGSSVYAPMMLGRVGGSRPQSASTLRSPPEASMGRSPYAPMARAHSSLGARPLMPHPPQPLVSPRPQSAAIARPPQSAAPLIPTPPRPVVVMPASASVAGSALLNTALDDNNTITHTPSTSDATDKNTTNLDNKDNTRSNGNTRRFPHDEELGIRNGDDSGANTPVNVAASSCAEGLAAPPLPGDIKRPVTPSPTTPVAGTVVGPLSVSPSDGERVAMSATTTVVVGGGCEHVPTSLALKDEEAADERADAASAPLSGGERERDADHLTPQPSEDALVGSSSGASKGSSSGAAPASWGALKALRDAGSAVVAIARLQRVMPWATLETLQERGVNVNNLDKILDKFVRFTYVARGKLLQQNLRRNRPALNPTIEWEQFIQGSDAVISTYTFVDAPLLGFQEERGDGMRRVEFTSSHMRFVGWGRDMMGERKLPYRELSSIDYSPSLQGALVTNFKLWSDAPVKIKIGANDSHAFLSLLVQRMSHNYFRGTNIVGGLMKKTVRIIHFNDVYHLEPFKNPGSKGLVGGASRFLTKVREIQKFHNPLILFSGDFMSPSLMSVLMKGKHMIDAFNLIGVHYGTFGNHEFDYGMPALSDAIHGTSKGNFVFAGSNTQWIMTNMTDKEGVPLCGVLQQEIVVWNGVRVGLLGLSENWLPQCGQLKKDDWVYHDSIATGERIAADMKANAGVEIVIALCHNRLSKDYELANGCKSIDLVLGGHDHFYKNSPANRTIKSGEEFEFLTEIEMTVDPTAKDGRAVRYRSTAHPITSDIEPHPSMETIIQRYDKRLEARMGKVIGTTPVPLDLTEACCRFKEGLAPGFIVDVMADRARADFAVLGGAAIAGKAVKPPGDITVGDIFSWFPNDTLIMTVKIKGSTVKKMLDVMVREVPLEAPSFPHPSRNLSFTINTMRTPTTVEDIRVRGAPIDPNADYVVAVEDFVGLGKAKYKFIPLEGETLCDDEAAEQITYWIIDFFEKDLDRSPNTDRQLKLLTNIAMRDKLFGITNAKSKLQEAAMHRSNSLGNMSASTASGTDLSEAIAALGDGTAAMLLSEASRLSTHQRAKLETVYFELETALKRIIPCEQVRAFHLLSSSNKAWYRTNDANARRVMVSLSGAVGHLVTSKKYEAFGSTLPLVFGQPHSCAFDAATEGVPSGVNNNFMCLPILHDRQPVCVIVFTNKADYGADGFSSRDKEIASLFLSQAQPVITFAVMATEKEEEEERRRELVSMASDLVQSNDTTTVNDKIVAVNKYCKQLFGVERATFYALDRNAEELWTVRRSVNTQRQTEDVILRKQMATAGVLASAMKLRKNCRYNEVSLSSPLGASMASRTERGYVRNALVVPVESQREKGELCGVLLLSDKVSGGFTQTDERLLASFTPFVAIAIDTSTEMEVLRTGLDRSKLKAFPVHELNRIRFKRGWGSVRSRLSYIASSHFKEKVMAASLGSPEGKSDGHSWEPMGLEGE